MKSELLHFDFNIWVDGLSDLVGRLLIDDDDPVAVLSAGGGPSVEDAVDAA